MGDLVIFRPLKGSDFPILMDFMETHFRKDLGILALSKGNNYYYSIRILNYNYIYITKSIIIIQKIFLNNSIIMLLREMANVVQLLFSLVSYFLIKDGNT